MRLLVFLFCLVINIVKSEELYEEVETQCIKNCPLQNRTDKGHYGYACDYNCHIEQCNRGCSLWRVALDRTCQEACSSTPGETPTQPQVYLYCSTGCNAAVAAYFQLLRLKLGTPPAPALLADSLGSTSLWLEWRSRREAGRWAGLTARVQWQYEELKGGWRYADKAEWDDEREAFLVAGLKPYTKYRFRVALLLESAPVSPTANATTTPSMSPPPLRLHNHAFLEPILSGESHVISTLAEGLPAAPPRNVRAAPVAPTSIGLAWEAGPFPNGPLLSYVLHITDDKHEEVINKDIPPESSFLMVRDLKPLRNYTIEIRMRNKRGPGPPSRIVVTTPAAPQSKNVQPPLILGTEHSILELRHILSEPITIYRCPPNVQLRGIAFHVNKKLLFITDTNGFVSKIPLEQDSNTKVDILKPNNLDFTPLDLTVDWLNDQLYIMGKVKYEMSKYRIKRCNFDGSGLTAVYGGLYMKPASIQIDPLNGYLFWTIQDFNKGGLYRLDVSDISNGMKHEAKNILNETELGAFTFEHHNFNILVAFQSLNTIKSVTLDGKEITDVRTSVTTPRLQRVISLAMANKVFYWTDGVDVFNEEYHEGTKNYFHNTIPHLTNGSYRKVFVNLQSSQPWPTPINPPTNLQAIFGRDIAKTRWQAPHLVGLQGKGAWQNWSYEISIREVTSGNTTTRNNINNTFFTITNLKENTEYILRVAAYTNSGKSPWSSEFKGSTLNASNNPVILWSAAEGLLRSNAAGENVETVIDKSDMGDFHFTDITWFKDQIYLVTNNSQVYWFNLTTKEQGLLSDMDSVGSIAVDWIGMKLYWSNPKQQLIIRGNLNGTDQEPLLTVLAKELNIDSTKAYLYWSTGIKVECAHLNGIDKFEYHDVQYFSGKQVMGLTLDMEEKFVYWIVRGSEGSNLYKAPMQGYWADERLSVKIVSSLQKPNIQGPLCYFHKRLLWLQDDKNAAISDLSGKNIATINGKHMWGLNMVYVVDPSLYMLPDDFDIWSKINVVPEIVNNSSIRVVGSSESFNVTWDSIKNVNYGVVFYEVQIDSPFRWRNYSSITVTTVPTVKYLEEIAPFTPLIVTIRAFTYWAASPQIRARIFSPPSTPSAPVNLRGFVEYERHALPEEMGRATVTVRWNPPANPNGVLQGFKVRCWRGEDADTADVCGDVIRGANQTEYRAKGLDDGRMYYFEVQAFTEIGTGTVSEPLAVNASNEWPIPTLLVASNDSIFIDDIDANQSYSLVEGMISPVEIAYLIKEYKIFWINQKQEIFMYDTKKSEQSRIFEIEGIPVSLTLDWLERSLYYAETSRDGRYSIYKVDLNELDRVPLRSIKILDSNSSITNIEISPFTKTLYWLERTENKHKLMQSQSDGSNVRPFFVDAYYSEDCNCPYFPEVGFTFSLDHSSSITKPLVIFVDLYSQNIVAADKEACRCQIIADNTLVKDSFPVERVEADFATVYWTGRETLYSMRRTEHLLLTKQDTVSDLMIYGRHTQPYPPKKCLSPKQSENYQTTLLSKTSNSLILQLPPELIHQECVNISMATVRYTVFYNKFGGNMDCLARNQCMSVTTMNKTKEIIGLKPFTRYSVWVVVSNYFSDGEGTIIGPPVVFQTAPGVPSKPQNVSAIVLSPTLAKVSWLPPEELNGIIVHYEIHWQTDSTTSGVRQKGELSVNNSDVLSTFLNKLSPNETYTVWVRVYSESNETSTDSDRVHITTYPEPSILLLESETAYGMRLSWLITQHVEKYSVEYALLTSSEWTNIETIHRDNERVIISVDNLKPKIHYKFRLSLLYEGNDDLYIWPSDSRFTFETLGDRPSPPGIPIIQYVKPNIYKVFWEASKDNGAAIEEYKLEGKELIFYRNKRSTNRHVPYYNTSPSVEIREEPAWMTYYNGTNTSWIINGLDENNKYAFRVSARNSYGWSNTSEESNEFDLNEAARIAEKQNPMNLIIIATGVPISICILVMMGFSYAICSGRGKQKKLQQVVPVPRVPDVELATLRELPRRGVHSTNILYVSTQPTPEELTLLPHIRRDQISLNKFLGSGAFGEVFEGKAKGIDNNNIETKVAVKTLKKGASEQEKSEFLQEAQLMSHFKHEHILQLLGVCLDNDPHFIIMELMEGGDLLTYLRDSRNPSTNTPSLILIELLKMCVDVSKGCRYLEEMHFVHRDLACRNCLVSSFDTEARIVKIGDFGLARDIYKNDYYRKEGEGLLPVRWMAPESLVDGVFTSQSDVWAFGVLLWEIMTLGQQPYPARANLEVLHYVRRGGRLGKPTDCPEDLHKLMLKCWEFEPDKRPTFKYCLEVLEELHRKTLRNPTTGAHEGQYISTVPEPYLGISNATYFRDENYNSSGNSWKCDVDEEKEKTPFLKPEIKEIPKYLELIYEPKQEVENDGYEIPKQMVRDSEIARRSSSNSISATLSRTKDMTDLAIHNLLSN